MTTPLYGHTSPDTAYVVPDYPYGFRLRCQIRYWLERTKHGFRLVSQTSNPKRPGLVWNMPKKSTYVTLAASMYLDDEKHVHWSGVGESTYAEKVSEFIANFPDAVTPALRAWVSLKVGYYEADVAGRITMTINKVPQPRTDADKARAHANLEAWQAIKTTLNGQS